MQGGELGEVELALLLGHRVAAVFALDVLPRDVVCVFVRGR